MTSTFYTIIAGLILGPLMSLNAQEIRPVLPELLFQQAEKQLRQQDEIGAVATWLQILQTNPSNAEALWKASFYSSRLGFRVEKEEQRVLYNRALDLGRRAVAVAPENADAHFALAVALGRISQISPARNRMEASIEINRHALRAVSINPEHAGAWHVHGLWHLRMANLSATEIEAAKVLYGEAPEGASVDRAIEAIAKSVDFSPGYLLYRYDLARALIAANRKEEAKLQLETLLAYPDSNIDDPGIHAKAREIHDRLGL